MFGGSRPCSCSSDGGISRGKRFGAAETTSTASADAKGSSSVCSSSTTPLIAGMSSDENTIFLGVLDAIACLNPLRLFLFDKLAIMIVCCTSTVCAADGSATFGKRSLRPSGTSFAFVGSS